MARWIYPAVEMHAHRIIVLDGFVEEALHESMRS